MTRPTPLQELPTGQILVGDVLDQLGRLPDDCIDTVLTSPAYYALRTTRSRVSSARRPPSPSG